MGSSPRALNLSLLEPKQGLWGFSLKGFCLRKVFVTHLSIAGETVEVAGKLHLARQGGARCERPDTMTGSVQRELATE